jgi:hypothetical protein
MKPDEGPACGSARKKSKKVCIRKGSFTDDLYLTRQGTWDVWEKRARFSSDDAAEQFTRRHVEGKN